MRGAAGKRVDRKRRGLRRQYCQSVYVVSSRGWLFEDTAYLHAGKARISVVGSRIDETRDEEAHYEDQVRPICINARTHAPSESLNPCF